MRESKEERLQRLHGELLREFDEIQSAVQDEREQCLIDRRFYSIAGAQWEGDLAEQFANKPRFEANKAHLAVIRIINEYRNNRITVDFVPKDGTTDDALADTCDALYRADESRSNAQEAYDNAFEEAVGGGFGAYRLRTEYEDESDPDNDRQVICIEPIYDADSCVFFDTDAKRQDKADARRCYVLTPMTPAKYKAEYDDSPASWPKSIQKTEYDWSTPDVVYVAEVYEVEEKKVLHRVFKMIDGSEERYTDAELDKVEYDGETPKPTLREQLEAVNAEEIRAKKIKTRKVRKYIMSGGRILEDCGYIAGTEIPIIPVYGKRWFVDGVERMMGHVRLVKDVQRLYNMQISRLGEISALSAVEKPIVTPEQIAGHETAWARDNIDNNAFLLINPTTDVNGNPVASGPLAYTKPPVIPQALAALLEITQRDIQEILGNQQQGEEVQANTSGKAVELIQSRLDMQTFIYMSNFAKAMKRGGYVWLSMAKEVNVEPGRKMKGIAADGNPMQIVLARPMMGQDGEMGYENDLTEADFDVDVDVGPTSSSKRSATVRALTGMITLATDPETQQVLTSMAMLNMEGEGISDIRDYFRRKLVRMGAVKPTDAEIEEMQAEAQNAPPDANSEYLQAAAENEIAKAAKAKADTLLTLAKTAQTEADTAQTVQGTNLEAIQALEGAARQLSGNSAETMATGQPMGREVSNGIP